MRVGIIGTRGIPNAYGGFEQFAEQLSVYLVERDYDITVYNSSLHPYQASDYKGVKLIHCTDWEERIGTAGQFIYDLNCILHARKQNFDIILQLGYTSSSVWGRLLPKKAHVITNMDGMEWKRSKFSVPVQRFLRAAERWAVKTSDCLVADSRGIESYLNEKYGLKSAYIAYAAVIPAPESIDRLSEYQVESGGYDMLIARMEPENNVETILDGYAAAKNNRTILVVGKCENDFGKRLVEKYQGQVHIRFLGGIYEQSKLNALRQQCDRYIHGHSVGGTNPSLLEAMSCGSFIIAHENPFNRAVLEEDARYFSTKEDIIALVDQSIPHTFKQDCAVANLKKITERYSPETIFSSYQALFERGMDAQKIRKNV